LRKKIVDRRTKALGRSAVLLTIWLRRPSNRQWRSVVSDEIHIHSGLAASVSSVTLRKAIATYEGGEPMNERQRSHHDLVRSKVFLF